MSDLQGEWAEDAKPVRDSIVDYDSARADWTGPGHALDRAMTLRCLAESWGALIHIEHEPTAYDAAARAYRSAIAIYDGAGDTLDAAQNQLALGRLMTGMALRDNNKEAGKPFRPTSPL